MKTNNQIKDIEKEAYKKAYGYWDNEYLDKRDFTIKRSIQFGVEASLKQFQKEIKEIQEELKYAIKNQLETMETADEIIDRLFKKRFGDLK